MRHLRLGLGLLATTSAFAFAAVPAMAQEFIASREGATHGVSETEQLFKFGAFKIKCQKASAKGAVAAGSSSTYATSIKYAKCLTSAFVGGTKHQIFLGTKWLTPLAIEYHANGFVETGSELEEVEGAAVLKGGTAVLKINTGRTEEFSKSECQLSWPEQTIPLKAAKAPEGEYSSATYTNASMPHLVNKNFPDGQQHYIVISNSFKGIKYEFEGEPCEEWGKEEGPEGGGGTYFGSFPQILGMGNLEFL
ncbi:MAG: hypothetical protein QOI18_1960 [Solirubrobacteraceae bacterium]|nr:hypothetical protein [Solirubrobacteraceae bacterium]